MLIDDDVWVTVRYRLFDAQGDALEPMERELTYLQGGYGSVFPAIEQALAGHASGYGTSVHLEPEDSFGDYDPELVRLAPRSRFPDDLEVGMTFEGVPGEEDEDDDPMYIVTDISDEAVVLDANHPLAGMALRFDLRVVGVRAASAEEIAHERALAEASGGQEDSDSLLRRPSSPSDGDFDERLVEDARGFLRAEADDEADDESDEDAADDDAADDAADDDAADDDGDDRRGPGRDAPPQRRLH